MSLLDNLPNTATAKRRVRTKDTLGGSKDSFETVYSGRACWLQQAGDSEVTEYAKRGINITNKVFFVADPELDENHVLEIGDYTYDVISSPHPDASAGLGVLWSVAVNRW